MKLLEIHVRTGLLLISTFVSLLLSFNSQATEIYVQAGPGSFNHAALDLLYSQTNSNHVRQYAGTPLNTYSQAVKNDSWAFSAIENSTIEGHLVPAIVEAFRDYRMIELKSAVRMPIEMCVFAKDKNQQVTHAASHPAALKQISHWLDRKNITPISEPKGTNEAARLLATDQLKSGTVAIGSCALKNVYSQLVLLEQGIQNSADNRTLFALMRVAKREQQVTTSQARAELSDVVSKANALIEAKHNSASHLFSLINSRLSEMKAVALFKAQQHRPIEDLTRETIVLDKALAEAKQQCLDENSVKDFFQAQMDAAKAIQYRYRAQWLSEGTPTEDADLNALRQSLNSLGTQILENLSNYLAKHGGLGTELATKFNLILETEHVSNTDKQRLFNALQRVRKSQKCD